MKLFKIVNYKILLLTLYFSPNICLATCQIDKPNKGFATCVYERFTTILLCKNKGTILSYFNIGIDSGNQITKSRQYFLEVDPIMANCQQNSAKPYSSVKSGFEVGYMTPSDLFDDDIHAAEQTNVMTNLLPQDSKFNKTGLWHKTEKIVDCLRDDITLTPLTVLSGAIFTDNFRNDYFSDSHGLPLTPDYFWKVVYSKSANSYDAWIFHNSAIDNSQSLKDHSRTIDSLVLTLSNINSIDYAPAIYELVKISTVSPEPLKVNFELETKCYRRRG